MQKFMATLGRYGPWILSPRGHETFLILLDGLNIPSLQPFTASWAASFACFSQAKPCLWVAPWYGDWALHASIFQPPSRWIRPVREAWMRHTHQGRRGTVPPPPALQLRSAPSRRRAQLRLPAPALPDLPQAGRQPPQWMPQPGWSGRRPTPTHPRPAPQALPGTSSHCLPASAPSRIRRAVLFLRRFGAKSAPRAGPSYSIEPLGAITVTPPSNLFPQPSRCSFSRCFLSVNFSILFSTLHACVTTLERMGLLSRMDSDGYTDHS